MTVRVMECSRCGLEFETDRSDEDAQQEFAHNFPKQRNDSVSVLCPDCYELFWQWAEVYAPELIRKV